MSPTLHQAPKRALRSRPVGGSHHPSALPVGSGRRRLLTPKCPQDCWRARYGAAPSSYDWSRTHARRRGGEALKRLQAAENGPRRPPSSICTGAGPRPSPTPSAAPKRAGVNAVDIRTRACACPSVNGSAEGRRDASAIRPSGRRDAASPRSSVSSRRLYGAHNSGIAGGHGHAVGATIATVA